MSQIVGNPTLLQVIEDLKTSVATITNTDYVVQQSVNLTRKGYNSKLKIEASIYTIISNTNFGYLDLVVTTSAGTTVLSERRIYGGGSGVILLIPIHFQRIFTFAGPANFNPTATIAIRAKTTSGNNFQLQEAGAPPFSQAPSSLIVTEFEID